MEQSFIKALYLTFIGWFSQMAFYFLPIQGLIEGLVFAFFVSFAFGIVTGIMKQGEKVHIKKAFHAFSELATYLVIIASLFVIGERMKGSDWLYEIMSAITWGMIYFYVANWTKNMKRLFPNSKGVAFLNFVMGLEFIKKIPYLSDFIRDSEKGSKKENPNDEKDSTNN